MAHVPELERLQTEKDHISSRVKKELSILAGLEGIQLFDSDVLIRFGIAAFSSGQLSPIAVRPDILARRLASEHLVSFEKVMELLGATPNKISDVVRLEDSPLTEALRNLDPSKRRIYERQFGILYALDTIYRRASSILSGNPEPQPALGIHIRAGANPRLVRIQDLSDQTVEIPTPRSVLEFGPGLSSLTKLTHEHEITIVKSLTMVEPSIFVVAALARTYELTCRLQSIINKAARRDPNSGFASRRLAHFNLINQTMGQFALNRSKETFDIVLASMIHSAGDSEILNGLRKTKAVLREGGHLAIQATDKIKPGETNATTIVTMANSLFGDPIRRVELMLEVQSTGEKHTGVSVLYRKNP